MSLPCYGFQSSRSCSSADEHPEPVKYPGGAGILPAAWRIAARKAGRMPALPDIFKAALLKNDGPKCPSFSFVKACDSSISKGRRQKLVQAGFSVRRSGGFMRPLGEPNSSRRVPIMAIWVRQTAEAIHATARKPGPCCRRQPLALVVCLGPLAPARCARPVCAKQAAASQGPAFERVAFQWVE